MAKKLTAKLSDGTEWEAEEFARDVTGTVHVKLTPLKPEPPKEIFVRTYGDGTISASYRSKDEAIKYTGAQSGPSSNIHRYTLAPEPEPEKKPREWWVVKDTEWPNMWCFFNTKDEALEHVKANQLYRTGPFLAREVVE